MRRSRLAMIAVTLGLLTLACSGGGSRLVAPRAVTESGSGQVSSLATGAGSLVQLDVTPSRQDTVLARVIDTGRYEPDDTE
jgi:hypothetical protein